MAYVAVVLLPCMFRWVYAKTGTSYWGLGSLFYLGNPFVFQLIAVGSPLPASRPHSSARSAEQGEGQGQCGEDKREKWGRRDRRKARQRKAKDHAAVQVAVSGALLILSCEVRRALSLTGR